ncbi:MAG: HU family DNA-binding protein [Bacteroidales bacterium]|nr:HU family DNA-binding protein [Candidatus Colicola caccequi]MCQ2328053.1 HU family DNA-binding protein [Paludibacteraceae bacterium]
MTKADLVNQIAFQTGYDKSTILNVVEAAILNVKKSVAMGDNVYLRGFGSFIVKTRAEKYARNVSAHKSILVPEHKIAGFRPSKQFNELVNNK